MNNKILLTAVMMMMMSSMVHGYSSAVNQSGLPAMENLTRADNVYEMTIELNRVSDGFIGIFIWLGIMIISFMLVLYRVNNPAAALGFGTFLGSIISVLMYIMDFGNAFMIYLSVLGLITSLVIMRLS